MKNKHDYQEKTKQQYCKKCKQMTYHRINVGSKNNTEKLSCIYCESLKKKKKFGVSKSKPKGGWTKLKFSL